MALQNQCFKYIRQRAINPMCPIRSVFLSGARGLTSEQGVVGNNGAATVDSRLHQCAARLNLHGAQLVQLLN